MFLNVSPKQDPSSYIDSQQYFDEMEESGEYPPNMSINEILDLGEDFSIKSEDQSEQVDGYTTLEVEHQRKYSAGVIKLYEDFFDEFKGSKITTTNNSEIENKSNNITQSAHYKEFEIKTHFM